jgi:hypothetical protein
MLFMKMMVGPDGVIGSGLAPSLRTCVNIAPSKRRVSSLESHSLLGCAHLILMSSRQGSVSKFGLIPRATYAFRGNGTVSPAASTI